MDSFTCLYILSKEEFLNYFKANLIKNDFNYQLARKAFLKNVTRQTLNNYLRKHFSNIPQRQRLEVLGWGLIQNEDDLIKYYTSLKRGGSIKYQEPYLRRILTIIYTRHKHDTVSKRILNLYGIDSQEILIKLRSSLGIKFKSNMEAIPYYLKVPAADFLVKNTSGTSLFEKILNAHLESNRCKLKNNQIELDLQIRLKYCSSSENRKKLKKRYPEVAIDSLSIDYRFKTPSQSIYLEVDGYRTLGWASLTKNKLKTQKHDNIKKAAVLPDKILYFTFSDSYNYKEINNCLTFLEENSNLKSASLPRISERNYNLFIKNSCYIIHDLDKLVELYLESKANTKLAKELLLNKYKYVINESTLSQYFRKNLLPTEGLFEIFAYLYGRTPGKTLEERLFKCDQKLKNLFYYRNIRNRCIPIIRLSHNNLNRIELFKSSEKEPESSNYITNYHRDTYPSPSGYFYTNFELKYFKKSERVKKLAELKSLHSPTPFRVFNTKTKKTYPSIKEAARCLNISYNRLILILNGKVKNLTEKEKTLIKLD